MQYSISSNKNYLKVPPLLKGDGGEAFDYAINKNYLQLLSQFYILVDKLDLFTSGGSLYILVTFCHLPKWIVLRDFRVMIRI